MSILSNGSTNAKTRKKLKEFKYEAVIQYMAPDKLADDKHTVCPWSTPGCRDSCLYTAGLGNTPSVQTARIGKTLSWLREPMPYVDELIHELLKLEKRAAKKRYKAVARLNGTSDISWEKKFDMASFNAIQFYDYTKSYDRMQKFLRGTFPTNYHLTFSYNEYTTAAEVHFIIAKGGNVAVVFRDSIPLEWRGYPVLSGDNHDFRFRDPKGYIIGLTAKGRAKKDSTGFVVD